MEDRGESPNITLEGFALKYYAMIFLLGGYDCYIKGENRFTKNLGGFLIDVAFDVNGYYGKSNLVIPFQQDYMKSNMRSMFIEMSTPNQRNALNVFYALAEKYFNGKEPTIRVAENIEKPDYLMNFNNDPIEFIGTLEGIKEFVSSPAVLFNHIQVAKDDGLGSNSLVLERKKLSNTYLIAHHMFGKFKHIIEYAKTIDDAIKIKV